MRTEETEQKGRRRAGWMLRSPASLRTGSKARTEAPDRHDIDLVSHWPSWRLEVAALAERTTAGVATIIKR